MMIDEKYDNNNNIDNSILTNNAIEIINESLVLNAKQSLVDVYEIINKNYIELYFYYVFVPLRSPPFPSIINYFSELDFTNEDLAHEFRTILIIFIFNNVEFIKYINVNKKDVIAYLFKYRYYSHNKNNNEDFYNEYIETNNYNEQYFNLLLMFIITITRINEYYYIYLFSNALLLDYIIKNIRISFIKEFILNYFTLIIFKKYKYIIKYIYLYYNFDFINNLFDYFIFNINNIFDNKYNLYDIINNVNNLNLKIFNRNNLIKEINTNNNAFINRNSIIEKINFNYFKFEYCDNILNECFSISIESKNNDNVYNKDNNLKNSNIVNMKSLKSNRKETISNTSLDINIKSSKIKNSSLISNILGKYNKSISIRRNSIRANNQQTNFVSNFKNVFFKKFFYVNKGYFLPIINFNICYTKKKLLLYKLFNNDNINKTIENKIFNEVIYNFIYNYVESYLTIINVITNDNKKLITTYYFGDDFITFNKIIKIIIYNNLYFLKDNYYNKKIYTLLCYINKLLILFNSLNIITDSLITITNILIKFILIDIQFIYIKIQNSEIKNELIVNNKKKMKIFKNKYKIFFDIIFNILLNYNNELIFKMINNTLLILYIFCLNNIDGNMYNLLFYKLFKILFNYNNSDKNMHLILVELQRSNFLFYFYNSFELFFPNGYININSFEAELLFFKNILKIIKDFIVT